jgi:hypothetical protein
MFRKSFVPALLAVLPAILFPIALLAQAPSRSTAGILAPLSAGETLDLPAVDERVPRPDAFLGYPLGTRFTHWDRIVAYLEQVAAASPRVKMWEYGRTYEGRPLMLVAIGSPANIQRLDEIRQEHQRLADTTNLPEPERDRITGRAPLVVWLAYGIHGNESSSAEAAMGVAYLLAAGQGDGTGSIARILENMVVLIDPLSNPDGRERYVSSFEQRRGIEPNPSRSAAEHWEPWPGGRQNHYLIDLNRDWAWASQQETRSRIAAYRSWEPQVYVDFHEMGSESSYFFPPAAEPIHPQIDRRVVSWLETFGRGNAEVFDKLGWVYFKGENYDLFYPGYGDSYPSLRGAVGMTYEMAGGGRGGLALALPDGTMLTLADRVARHLTTSMTTVRTASANGRRLLEDYVANRLKAASEPRAYLWAGDQPESRALADLLALHGIRVQQTTQATEIAARSLTDDGEIGGDSVKRFPPGTYVVSTTQPLGNLVEALLERESPMSEAFVERQRQRLEQNLSAQFYDITAWSLPYAFNVDTWVAPTPPAGLRSLTEVAGGIQGGQSGKAAAGLGFLVPPQGIATYRFAAELQKRRILHRVAMGSLSGAGGELPAGTLFIPRRGNSENVGDVVQKLLEDGGLTARAIDSSFEMKGISLGSNEVEAVKPVRAGLVSGMGVDPTSFGFLWHLLDEQIRVPHDRLDLAQLAQVDLSELDVLILPSGNYEEALGARGKEAVDAWVKGGGVLIAVGDSIEWLQKHEMTGIKSWEPAKKDEDEGNEDPEGGETEVEKSLESRPIFTPGAILATQMRPNHPLTLGLRTSPKVLYEGTVVLKTTGDPRKDVLVAEGDPVVAGFAWPEAEERLSGSLLVGMETRGRGGVVLFAQDPAFRLFWRATTPLLLNAILYGPSTGVGGRF